MDPIIVVRESVGYALGMVVLLISFRDSLVYLIPSALGPTIGIIPGVVIHCMWLHHCTYNESPPTAARRLNMDWGTKLINVFWPVQPSDIDSESVAHISLSIIYSIWLAALGIYFRVSGIGRWYEYSIAIVVGVLIYAVTRTNRQSGGITLVQYGLFANMLVQIAYNYPSRFVTLLISLSAVPFRQLIQSLINCEYYNTHPRIYWVCRLASGVAGLMQFVVYLVTLSDLAAYSEWSIIIHGLAATLLYLNT